MPRREARGSWHSHRSDRRPPPPPPPPPTAKDDISTLRRLDLALPRWRTCIGTQVALPETPASPRASAWLTDPAQCRPAFLAAAREAAVLFQQAAGISFGADETAPPAADIASQRRAACNLAVAVGRCLLLHVPLEPGEDLTFAWRLASLAGAELVERLGAAAADAAQLPARLKQATPAEHQGLAVQVLSQRMDLWAAYHAIDESYAAALERCDGDLPEFSGLMDQLLQAGEAMDSALELVTPALAPALQSPSADRWRRDLSHSGAWRLPWWL